MNKLVLAALVAATLAMPACAGSRFTPQATALTPALTHRSGTSLAGKAAPTPYPLPKQTPDWQIVEKPVPYDFHSVGPDRSACKTGEGLTYRVGPGQAYPQPHNVPWLRLLPCDTVLIYPSAAPYSDVIYLASRGRVHKAITVSGVLDPKTGARPVFDGTHAISWADQDPDKYLLCNGMIVIGNPDPYKISYKYGYKPGYLIVENLEIRNAFGKYPGSNQPVYTCTDTSGVPHPWAEFSAGIDVDPAEHLLVQNMYLHRNGLGMFTNSIDYENGQSRDFIVKDNTILNNGNGEASLHNMYNEVVGERVIHNYFGPPIVNTQGENIKDRGVCVEFADNYIDSGNNLIAARDPQSNAAFEVTQVDAYGTNCASEFYVHGNTFVSRGPTEFQGMSTIVGFGDGTIDGAPQYNRWGSFYFYDNVAIAIANRNNYGLKAAVIWQNGNQLHPSTFYATNNLFYSAPQSKGNQAPTWAACLWQQYVDFTTDWSSQKMLVKFATATDGEEAVGTPCSGSGMGGIAVSKADPGFVDFAHGDFHLKPSSPYYSLKAQLPAAVTQRGLLPDGVPYPTPQP